MASDLAPQPGAYPPAVQVGREVYVSAQLPLDGHGRPVGGDLDRQLSRSLENVRLHLQAAGLQPDAVARLTIYVAAPAVDAAVAATVDAALAAVFVKPWPACSVVGVAALPSGALVSVEAVAVRY